MCVLVWEGEIWGQCCEETVLQTPTGRAGADLCREQAGRDPGKMSVILCGICEGGRVCDSALGCFPWDCGPRMSGWLQLPRMSLGEGIFLVKRGDVSFHPHRNSMEGWLLPFPGQLLCKESLLLALCFSAEC